MVATERRAAAAAVLMDADRTRFERVGLRALRSIGRRLLVDVPRAYQRGEDVGPVIASITSAATPVLTLAMVGGHAVGSWRSTRVVARAVNLRRGRRGSALAGGVTPYEEGIVQEIERSVNQFLLERSRLTPAQVERITTTYGNEAANVTRRFSASVEERVQAVIRENLTKGLTWKEGAALVREELVTAGVNPQASWLFETLYRTQTQIAYSAGRQAVYADTPAIQEILWGWEYTAMMDERTREGHAALDGTRLAKDDPQWRRIFPPNGFNCRCTAVEVFKGERDARDRLPSKDGRPDEGWDFNPFDVFRLVA